MSKEGLTTKQRLFVESYLSNGFNATEAARAAGYKGSYGSLRVIGHENLTKLNIQNEISLRLTQFAMPANEVLVRLADHARGSIEDLIDVDGYFIRDDLKKAKEKGKLHLIKKITFNDFGGVKSFELHDPQSALVHLGKHHRLFDRAGEETPNAKELALALIKQWQEERPDIPMEQLYQWAAEDFGIDKTELITEANN